MRKLTAIIPLLVTIWLVYLLDKPHGSLPALGRLLDPVNGFWANAEPTRKDFSIEIAVNNLKQPVSVHFDDRLVPHIKATDDYGAYFAQGYIHACFRLWQMDLQTRAAGGRVSEILGEKALNFDREQRRKGMVYAAENSLKAMEADPRSKQMLDAYTAGVNAYISQLRFRNYPLEYKLMGFAPEPWTNIKSALLLKYMADDLTGETDDIAYTIMQAAYNKYATVGMDCVFPGIKGITPVIPSGTQFTKPSLTVPATPPDSEVYVSLNLQADFAPKEEQGKGSNNWVLSGKKTKSGAAILCNDPHLGLNLPSLWFETQLQTPGLNVYGVSLPGAPGVIIGFNENISWGFTNNYRDVKDFYAIKPSADNNFYLFDGKQLPFEKRVEVIHIKGRDAFTDTVRYTVHGPVMYDSNFNGPGGLKKPLAMCWMAHRPTNELLSVYLLNRSSYYEEFVTAIQQFQCPAQNIAYADNKGNIALWGQGQFVNKWKGQGVYVMNGIDSSTLWRELIPMGENPHALNPEQGFLSSANQTVTDSTYPYWYNGTFHQFRAWRINSVLAGMQGATTGDMFALQNDNYSVLAARALPIMLGYMQEVAASPTEQKCLRELEGWDYRLEINNKAASVFHLVWEALRNLPQKRDRIYNTYHGLTVKSEWLMESVLREDSIDGCRKNVKANVQLAFKSAAKAVDSIGWEKMEWYKVKNTSVRHLTKIPAFGFDELKIGGWGNTVNAAKGGHGPSWRMVVEMDKDIAAWGVYPGGQSGNPGSKYYATFLDKWVKGEYYKLVFLKGDAENKSIKYKMILKPEK